MRWVGGKKEKKDIVKVRCQLGVKRSADRQPSPFLSPCQRKQKLGVNLLFPSTTAGYCLLFLPSWCAELCVGLVHASTPQITQLNLTSTKQVCTSSLSMHTHSTSNIKVIHRLRWCFHPRSWKNITKTGFNFCGTQTSIVQTVFCTDETTNNQTSSLSFVASKSFFSFLNCKEICTTIWICWHMQLPFC